MTKVVSARDARANFSELLNLVDYRGDEVVVKRFDKPAVVWLGYQAFQKLKSNQAVTPGKKRTKTSHDFLIGLSKLGIKGGPKDLAVNHDKYLYE